VYGAALEEQNRKLMAQLGLEYNLPDITGKHQPLQPLQLSAGQGDARNFNIAGQMEMDHLVSAVDTMQGGNKQQLQPLRRQPGQSLGHVVDNGQGQRNQLQPSASAPALSSLPQGPEALLKQMLQRGDINFKEYKEQLAKLKQ
jgi:hypothetical protein